VSTELQRGPFITEEAAKAACPTGWTIRKSSRGRAVWLVPPDQQTPVEKKESNVSAIDEHAAKPKHRTVVYRTYSKIAEEPLINIYPGLLWAGKHTTVGGVPGLGKTLIWTDIAARLSRGGKISPYSDEQFAPVTVLAWSGEDDAADTLKPRLRVAGADLTRVLDLIGVLGLEGNHEHLNLGEHLPALDKALAVTGARVLVLDPISSVLGKIDSHQNTQVRAVLDPIKRVLEKHKAALLSIQHLSKNDRTSAINRFSGSISFVGAPRAAFMCLRNPLENSKADRWLLPAKCNLIPEAPGYALRIASKEGQPVLEWSTARADVDLDEALGVQGPTKTEVAEDLLRSVLMSGAVSIFFH
jgi:putative DNA primase/helicase